MNKQCFLAKIVNWGICALLLIILSSFNYFWNTSMTTMRFVKNNHYCNEWIIYYVPRTHLTLRYIHTDGWYINFISHSTTQGNFSAAEDGDRWECGCHTKWWVPGDKRVRGWEPWKRGILVRVLSLPLCREGNFWVTGVSELYNFKRQLAGAC